jgi:hypothetical protein
MNRKDVFLQVSQNNIILEKQVFQNVSLSIMLNIVNDAIPQLQMISSFVTGV